MKLLKEILYGTRIQDILGNTHVAIEDLAFDSRKVKAFSLFVAIPGVSVDGHDFIEQAAAQGATAIVCERLPEHAPSTSPTSGSWTRGLHWATSRRSFTMTPVPP